MPHLFSITFAFLASSKVWQDYFRHCERKKITRAGFCKIRWATMFWFLIVCLFSGWKKDCKGNKRGQRHRCHPRPLNLMGRKRKEAFTYSRELRKWKKKNVLIDFIFKIITLLYISYQCWVPDILFVCNSKLELIFL